MIFAFLSSLFRSLWPAGPRPQVLPGYPRTEFPRSRPAIPVGEAGDPASPITPDETRPNEFEQSLLDRIAERKPSIRPYLPELSVVSREFTGVGCFTNFACDDSDCDGPWGDSVLNATISMPGVPAGMTAVLFVKGDRPDCLEVVTYDGPWDGDYEGFSIGEDYGDLSAGAGVG